MVDGFNLEWLDGFGRILQEWLAGAYSCRLYDISE
jgi:hypothetical protein